MLQHGALGGKVSRHLLQLLKEGGSLLLQLLQGFMHILPERGNEGAGEGWGRGEGEIEREREIGAKD